MNTLSYVKAFAVMTLVLAASTARADREEVSRDSGAGPGSALCWPGGDDSASSRASDPSVGLNNDRSSALDFVFSTSDQSGFRLGDDRSTRHSLQTSDLPRRGTAGSSGDSSESGSSRSSSDDSGPSCTLPPCAVPEPTSLILLALSIAFAGGLHMRRRLLSHPIV